MNILSILSLIASVSFSVANVLPPFEDDVRFIDEEDSFVASQFVGKFALDDTCRQDLCCCFVGNVVVTQLNDGSLRITIEGKGIAGAICPADDGDLPRNDAGDVFIPITLDKNNPEVFTDSLIGQVFTFVLDDGAQSFQILAPNPICNAVANRQALTTPPPTEPPEANDKFIGTWRTKDKCPDTCHCCPSDTVSISQEKSGGLHIHFPADDCADFDRDIAKEDATSTSFSTKVDGDDFSFTLKDQSQHLKVQDTEQDECSLTLSKNVDTSSLTYLQILFVAFAGGVLFVIVLAYFFFRSAYPEANNLIAFRAGFAFLDFVSDCAFVYEVFRLSPDIEYNLKYYAIAFVVIPAIINIFLLVRIFMLETQSSKMKKWFERHSSLATGVLVLSCTKLDVITLLYSRIMNLEVFKMPFSDVSKARVEWYGIAGNVIEDVPQFVLQMLLVSQLGVITPIVGISIASTIITICFEIIRRCLIFIFRRIDFHRNIHHSRYTTDTSVHYKQLDSSEQSSSSCSVNNSHQKSGRAGSADPLLKCHSLLVAYEQEMKNSLDLGIDAPKRSADSGRSFSADGDHRFSKTGERGLSQTVDGQGEVEREIIYK